MMRYRPANRVPDDPRLGRYVPDDWRHLDRYPLTAAAPVQTPTPVIIGVNWYEEMHHPARDTDGRWWIVPHGPRSLNHITGGHAVCLEPGNTPTSRDWHRHYDQIRDGACVGFAWSRAMSILNGTTYSARWLWDRAKERDRWLETNPGDENGTSLRAGADALRALGHVRWETSHRGDTHIHRAAYVPSVADGIRTYRWARTVDEVHAVLTNPDADRLGAVPLLNSWGLAWPYRVWLPDEVLGRLLAEDGEAAIPTDR